MGLKPHPVIDTCLATFLCNLQTLSHTLFLCFFKKHLRETESVLSALTQARKQAQTRGQCHWVISLGAQNASTWPGALLVLRGHWLLLTQPGKQKLWSKVACALAWSPGSCGWTVLPRHGSLAVAEIHLPWSPTPHCVYSLSVVAPKLILTFYKDLQASRLLLHFSLSCKCQKACSTLLQQLQSNQSIK